MGQETATRIGDQQIVMGADGHSGWLAWALNKVKATVGLQGPTL